MLLAPLFLLATLFPFATPSPGIAIPTATPSSVQWPDIDYIHDTHINCLTTCWDDSFDETSVRLCELSCLEDCHTECDHHTLNCLENCWGEEDCQSTCINDSQICHQSCADTYFGAPTASQTKAPTKASTATATPTATPTEAPTPSPVQWSDIDYIHGMHMQCLTSCWDDSFDGSFARLCEFFCDRDCRTECYGHTSRCYENCQGEGCESTCFDTAGICYDCCMDTYYGRD